MLELRQKHGRAGERYWKIEVRGDAVITEWGALKDGELNKHGATKDIPGPKGKEGTKSYYTAEKNAEFNADRLIRKKREEGYVEPGEEESVSVIDFTKPLPKNLAFSKPKNSMDPKRMLKIANTPDDAVLFTRKVNGMAAIIYLNANREITIYSRRLEDVTEKFPHLVRELKSAGALKESIILVESFMGEGNSKEDFNKMQQIMNAKTDHALAVQKDLGPAHFYVYRVPFWGGAFVEGDMINVDYIEWLEDFLHGISTKYLHPLEVQWGTIEEAETVAKERGYEGWVAYQANGKLKDYSYSFHGKPNRPSCVWKVKYSQEDDFSARWDPKRTMSGGHCKKGCQYKDHKQVQVSGSSGTCVICGSRMVGDGTLGSGKHSGQVGTLSLYQNTPKGVPVYICEVGTGMTDAQKKELADPTLYPLCVRVIFDDRRYRANGDDSNALLFPRLDEIREDKEPSECVNEELTLS